MGYRGSTREGGPGGPVTGVLTGPTSYTGDRESVSDRDGSSYDRRNMDTGVNKVREG